ncbi:MAG TPA: alpha/beta hydrolase [Anaeromyxobacteraceae bacterium]|nr:alpha/beta hydrolase [Anaeromyxobacteraceae bacterium]
MAKAAHRSLPVALALLAASAGGCLPAGVGARLIFETKHNPVTAVPSLAHEDVSFAGEGGVWMRGWLFHADEPRRGTVIFLHGRNQNREQALPIAARFVSRGYDVLAFDLRAHGQSTGTYSTFGYLEKGDLSRAIDRVGADEVTVVGVSLGAAVALQAAAEDPRIAGVVAVASFSSLQQVVRDQIPWFVPTPLVRGTLHNAESRIGFHVEEADTVRAARRVLAPVLLLHGADDRFVVPAHSRAIYAALHGPRELVLVEGARHGDVLAHERAWDAIWSWLGRRRPIETAAAQAPSPAGRSR